MATWSGLGLNYKSINPTNIAADLALFRTLGIQYLRVQIPESSDTSERAIWRAVALQCKQAGFYTVWGVTHTGITSANWATKAQYALDELQICQTAQVCDEFQIGNECEVHHDTSLTNAQVRDNVRTLATSAKTVVNAEPDAAKRIKISYAAEATATVGEGSDAWASDVAGMGDLDVISMNFYGLANNSFKYVKHNYLGFLSNFRTAFGDKCHITEWNLDTNNTNLQNLPYEVRATEIGIMLKNIKDAGFTRAHFFQWCGYKNGDNQYALSQTNGSFDVMWDVLMHDHSRRTFVEF